MKEECCFKLTKDNIIVTKSVSLNKKGRHNDN